MDESQKKALYEQLKQLLAEYGGMFSVYDHPRKYSLHTKKLIVVNGKKPQEIYFAGLRENKNMVSFHFMPIYCNPPLLEKVPTSLKKILKGKTCFNVKTLTPAMVADLHMLIKLGIAGYTKLGWL